VLVTQALSAICSLALAFVSWRHLVIPDWPLLQKGNHFLSGIASIFERHAYFHFDDRSLPLIYLILLTSAIARTFGWAARSSYFPQLVPRDAFANAVTWNSSVFQIGSVVGPAIGGLLIVRAGFPFIYVLDAICATSFFLLVLPIRSSDRGSSSERNAWRSLKEGIRFTLSKKVILATITLDMFAVFLGGATALLPIFADQILHCGPIGLGWMRAADCLSAADEARGQNTSLVRDRFRARDDHLRRIPLSLALARDAFYDGRVR
jgi:MFS family permease